MRLRHHDVATLLLAFSAAACALSPREEPPETPQLFAPGTISDARWQWRVAFSPDGRELFFAASDDFFPRFRRAAIYVSRRENGQWSAPVLAPFSGRFSDIDPAFSSDGRRLYFSSIRPDGAAPRTDLDVWFVERTASGWGTPQRLGPEVNTEQDELYPSLADDGTLYVASGPIAPRAGAHWDIYVARPRGGSFAPRERLGGAINTVPDAAHPGLQDAWEFNPEISRDGQTLVFTSLRPGGAGLGDLYVSHWRDGEWTPARNLGAPVNTPGDEYHPTLSRDGRTLYFVRRAPQGRDGDFHRVGVRNVPALRR